MYSKLYKLRRVVYLASAGYVATAFYPNTSLLMQEDSDTAYKLMQHVVFQPSFQRLDQLDSLPNDSLVQIYSEDSFVGSEEQKLESDIKSYKIYLSSQNQTSISQALELSPEDLQSRIRSNASFFYKNNGKYYPIPSQLSNSDFNLWIRKCQEPILYLDTEHRFYSLARTVIRHDEQYLVLTVAPDDQLISKLQKISGLKYKVAFAEVTNELAQKLGLGPGVYLCKPYSKYDGDFDLMLNGQLKYIPVDASGDYVDLANKIQDLAIPKITYVNSINRIPQLFQRIHTGPLRCLYVLTSQLNPYSGKYNKILEALTSIAESEKERLIVAIVTDDEVAAKLGVIRDKTKRFRGIPDVRLVDYHQLVSTIPDESGNLPTVDCSEEASCSELLDTHYIRKTNYQENQITQEGLREFVEKSIKGELEMYYENQTPPMTNIRKISAVEFKQEVLESPKDVLLEIYGKYCPGCRAFAPKFNEFAGKLTSYKGDLLVGKICADYNQVPELVSKKPFTPIFWYYKKGDKENPVKYEGKYDQQELMKFVKENATFELKEDVQEQSNQIKSF